MNAAPILAQKHLRERLAGAMRGGPFGVLDIGASKVAALIVQADPAALAKSGEGREADLYSGLRIVGAGSARSLGVGRDGMVFDAEGAAEALSRAVSEAEAGCGARISQALVAVGGLARLSPASAALRLGGKPIEDRDLARALEACRPEPTSRAREPIDAYPVGFSLDGVMVKDPRGKTGRRLAAEIRVVSVDRTALGALARAARLCGIEPVGAASSGYASGLACLSDDELDLGAICLDMGGGSTHAAAFRGGRLLHADLEPMGGQHVTNDVAAALGVGFQEAERLKKTGGEGAAPMVRSTLERVIRPRLDEIFEMLHHRLTSGPGGFAVEFAGRPIVLTGGASQTQGALEAARAVFGPRVRLGRPIRPASAAPGAAAPEYAAAAGLAAHALRAREDAWIGPLLESLAPRGGAAAAWDWWRRNW